MLFLEVEFERYIMATSVSISERQRKGAAGKREAKK